MANLEVPASLPRARKSLSALNDPANAHLFPSQPHPSLTRSESDDVAARSSSTNGLKGKDALKRRAMSIGGNAIAAGVTDPVLKSLSPRSFRRVAKPRKSILKATSAHSPRRNSNSPSKSRRPSLPRSNIVQTTPSKRLPSSNPITSSPLATTDRYAHTIDFSGSNSMLGKNSQANDDDDDDRDDGFEDLPLHHNQDLTLPATLHSRSRMSYAGGSSQTSPQALHSTTGMTDKEKAKAARRAFLASRKSVSFAPHAYVRMFDTLPSATPTTGAGAMISAAAAAAASASSANAAADSGKRGFDFGKLGEHESNLTKDGLATDEAGTRGRSGSSRRHGRQSSITSISELPTLVQPRPVSAEPERGSSRRRSTVEVGDESGMSMDIETDSETEQAEGDDNNSQEDGDEDEEDMDIEGQTMDFTSISAVNVNVDDEVTTGSIFSSEPVAQPAFELPRFSVRRDLSNGPKVGPYAAFSEELALMGQDQREVDEQDTRGSSIFTSGATPASPAKRMMRGRLSIGDDVTVDMDITEIVAGSGTLRATGSPASTVSARSDDENEEDSDDDEDEEERLANDGPDERTMDFTVAVGGIIPGLPPVNAWRNAESIGYIAELPDGYDPSAGHTMGSIFSSASGSSPLRTNVGGNNPFSTSATVDDAGTVFTLPVMSSTGDESVDMDETMAVGGILTREDQTISSVDDDELPPREPTLSFARNDDVTGFSVFSSSDHAAGAEQEMDFTIAHGGILSEQQQQNQPSVAFSMNVTSPSVPGSSHRAGASSRGSTMPVSPASARQSTSSTSNRDRYGPSPSPPRTVEGVAEDDPIGRSIDAAKDVAKKLVFTPTKTASPRKVSPAKRSFETELPSTDVSKARRTTETGDKENMAPIMPIQTPKSPSRNTSASTSERPRTPSKRLAEFGGPQRSPHKHLAPRSPARATPSRSTRPTTPSRLARTETVAEPEWAQQEFSNISLGNFLEMTGIHFMTSMPTATRRKSVLNGGMPAEYMQRMLQSDIGDYPLDEYAAAMNAWFYYKMYHWACQQMQQDIENTQENLDELNRDASVDNPMIVRDYLAASDEEKSLFEEMLQNLKTNARLIAKEKWYEWRLQLSVGVQTQIQAMNSSLKGDKERIDTIRKDTAESLPHLRERRMALQKILAQEKLSIEAVTGCDQAELKELRTAIAEQGAQITSFTAEYQEQTEKLDQLQHRLEEHKTQKHEISVALAAARRECEQSKGFTKSEAFALEQEFKSLQTFNSWRLEKLNSAAIELVYDEEIRLTASCSASRPSASSCSLELMAPQDGESSATRSLFDVIKQAVEKKRSNLTFSKTVQLVAHMWTAAQRLRSEFKMISLRYPTKYTFSEESKNFTSCSTILLPSSRAKIQVAFTVDEAILASWPESVGQVGVSVTKVYGSIDADGLTDFVKERMNTATAGACLLAFSQCCVDLESL